MARRGQSRADRAAAGEYDDLGGPALKKAAQKYGWQVQAEAMVPDDIARIQDALRSFSAQDCALILTTGGTGIAARDVTPEATLAVADRVLMSQYACYSVISPEGCAAILWKDATQREPSPPHVDRHRTRPEDERADSDVVERVDRSGDQGDEQGDGHERHRHQEEVARRLAEGLLEERPHRRRQIATTAPFAPA